MVLKLQQQQGLPQSKINFRQQHIPQVQSLHL